MYRGFLGSGGTRFLLQRSNDIYFPHHYHSDDPVLYRQTYVCLGWGIGGIYLERADNPRALAALVFGGVIADVDDPEDEDYMPVDAVAEEDDEDDGVVDQEIQEDEFDLDDEEPDEFGEEQDPDPDAGQPGEPMQVDVPAQPQEVELNWDYYPNIDALVSTWDFGPSIDPPFANPIHQHLAQLVVDGQMKDGFNMPWNRTITEERHGDLLHYHQHYRRRYRDHGPIPPRIMPEHDGNHHQFPILQYGTQVQAFRQARQAQPGGDDA